MGQFNMVVEANVDRSQQLDYSLAVLQNGDLASGSEDKTIKIWDSSTWSLKRTLTGHSDWVRSLAVLKNGDLAS